jgi:hypothetical protein
MKTMKTKYLAAALAMVVLIPAIYYIYFWRAAACSGQPHCIIINVSIAGSSANIQDPGTYTVEANQHSPVLFWEIQTAGYSFPNDGIDFYPMPPKPANQAPPSAFKVCHPIGQGNTQFQCTDDNSNKGTFAYKITLQNSSSVPQVQPIDPLIVNN